MIDLYSLSFILLTNSNRKGRGGGLKKEVGAYVSPEKGRLIREVGVEGRGVFERGRLIEDLQ